MKITSAYIDGFGIFNDQSLSGLDGDLVIFFGNNEAGKSTLLGFFRSVLFGFPRANSRDPSYPALAGGIHGGRIDMTTNTGEIWSISRKPGKGGGAVIVTGQDGTAHDGDKLDRLLGGVTYEAFRNIMAFGLSELQSIETLSGEHIASAIYGAGLGTSMMAMPSALKTIRNRKEALFKQKGKKILNRLFDDLEQTRKALHEASLRVEQYDVACETLADVDRTVATCRKKLAQCRRRKQEYEALERLWPEWVVFQECRQELFDLGTPVKNFPEDGLQVLDRLVTKREQKQNTLENLKTHRTRLSDRFADLPVDDKVLSQAAAIGSLVENRNVYEESARKLPLLVQEHQQTENTIQRLLKRLGSQWLESVILDFDRSLFSRETIRKHATVLNTLEKNLAAANTLLKDKETTVQQAMNDCKKAEKEVSELGGLPLKRDAELIQKLKQGQDRFADALDEYRRVSSSLNKAKDKLFFLKRTMEKSPAGTKWPAVMVCCFGAATVGISAFFGTYHDAALLIGATVVATWATWVYRLQQQRAREYRLNEVHRQENHVQDLAAAFKHLESIQNSYIRLASEVLGPEQYDYSREEALLIKVGQFFAGLSNEEQKREAIMLAKNRLEEKMAAIDTARLSLEKATAARQSLARQYDEEMSKWETTCRKLGFSTSVSPDTALEALDTIEQTVESILKRDHQALDIARLQESVDTFRKTARKTLSALNQPSASDDELPQKMTELVASLEDSKGNQREKETLERQLQGLEMEMTEGEKSLQETEKAIHLLLSAVKSTDEAQFREIGKTEHRRSERISAADTAEKNIRRISGEIDIEPIKKKLESLSITEITTRKEVAAEEVRDLDTQLQALYTRRAELNQTLETFSTNDDITRLRVEEAGLLADLERNAREWSRNALAEHLILQAKEIYEQKHQPRIIQDAGIMFRRMTGGAYSEIVSPLGENSLSAVTNTGERIPPGALSRGTVEQLYLAVRFSYIQHQGRGRDPLPLIMDDILVNFDPIRAQRAAETIKALSETHQVLYFTCHPETLSIFKKIQPGVSVCRLESGRIFTPDTADTLKEKPIP